MPTGAQRLLESHRVDGVLRAAEGHKVVTHSIRLRAAHPGVNRDRGGRPGHLRAWTLPGAPPTISFPTAGGKQKMAHSKSALKRIRQNVKHAAENRPYRTRAARSVRVARAAIRSGAADAPELVREAQAALDRAARRHIIHRNSAARRKSRLMLQLKASQAA
jgi:small subunit ribosomal protein S20